MVEFSVADFLPNDVFLRLIRQPLHVPAFRASVVHAGSEAPHCFLPPSPAHVKVPLMILSKFKLINTIKLCVPWNLDLFVMTT